MQQYKKLLKTILEKGTYKAPAREGMPGTTSLFGYQFRHNLADGFPLLTTKKVNFKSIVTELLWFLKGDTNIKYLVDNGCNIWNEDAYNYYVKSLENEGLYPIRFEHFVDAVKTGKHLKELILVHGGKPTNYELGDCGMQYGKLWREWNDKNDPTEFNYTDQIKELLEGLKENPLSRRHIVTAWNPTTLDKMALNACHALVQFNCRPLTLKQREEWFGVFDTEPHSTRVTEEGLHELLDNESVPRYYLDCQMYQRSADVFLGVPFNIASYALLTTVFAQICNMIPGDFIHTFGDVHIYDNHMDQVKLQLTREEKPLPKLIIDDEFWNPEGTLQDDIHIIDGLLEEDFQLLGYDPHPAIKAKLSTGLK